MKDIRCILGLHSYKRLDDYTVPVKEDGEYNELVYKGHYAFSQCRRCGKFAMVQCFGKWTYRPSDMKTLKEWFDESLEELALDKKEE